MANVTIVTIGTRGDVVPYTSIGAALTATGDRVTIATHASLRGFVDEAGLGFAALPVEFGAEPLNSTRFAKVLAAHWLPIGRAIADASRDADLLILAPMGMLGYHIAQARGIPSMGAFLQPLEPTRAFPPPILTTRSLGGWGNRVAAHAFRVLGQVPFARATAEFRSELGLAPLGARALFRRLDEERWPALYGFSPTVVPPPEDWPAHRPMTGYWWPPVPTGLSARVRNFLDAGEPPVYIGSGSTGVRLEVKRLGRRVVVRRGSADLPAEDPNVLVIDDEPHAELFPRMAVVVHHGGAGTAAAAMRAGVPSVTVPFSADQAFWGERIADLHAGPRPVPARDIARAIDEAAHFRAGAQAVSRRLAEEDGVGAAVAEIRKVG